MSNVSGEFSNQQSQGNKYSSDATSQSNAGFNDINNAENPSSKGLEQAGKMKTDTKGTNMGGEIDKQPAEDVPTRTKFDAKKGDPDSVTAKQESPNKEGDEGVLARAFKAVKQEAKDWMMGKLEAGLNEMMGEGDQGKKQGVDSANENKKLGVGKIPVLSSNPSNVDYQPPSPTLPSPNIPQASVPNMNMPKISIPKFPKF